VEGDYATAAQGALADSAVQPTDLIDTSTGVADAGKPIKLDVDGQVDSTMINDADINLDNVTEGTTNKFFTAADKTKLDALDVPNKYVEALSGIVVGQAYTVTHNLNDAFFIVQLWDDATNESILANLSNRTVNSVTVTFVNEAPTGTVQVIVKI
jgi:hypothetical protein